MNSKMKSCKIYCFLMAFFVQKMIFTEARPSLCGFPCPDDCDSGIGLGGGGFGGSVGLGGGFGFGGGPGCGPIIPPSPPISFQPVPQPIPIRIPSRPPPSVTIPNIIVALLPPKNKPCIRPVPVIRPPPPLVFPLPQPYPVPICDSGCGSIGGGFGGACAPPCGC